MVSRRMDMFNCLPDSLITIIISFLPFKEAARTCILSRRWRNLWRATTTIDFDESFFVNREDSDETQKIQRQAYVDFTRRWIQNYREPSLKNLRLTFSRPEDFLADMKQCVAFAVAGKPKLLSLDFSDPAWRDDGDEDHNASIDLNSSSHFGGTSNLESLKLYSCNFLLSEIENFRALKDLSIGWIELSASKIEAVLSNCKMLESLSLKNCRKIYCLQISEQNLKLKRLVVDKCDFEKNLFLIEAPKLEFFKYSGNIGFFEIEIKSCMEEADLDFGLEFECGEEGHLLQKLLEGLHCVRVLHVCTYMLQMLPHGEEPLKMPFPMRVNRLTLRTALHPNELFGISFMLESCPILETLCIEICPPRILEDYVPPYKFVGLFISKCLKRTLKVVEVKGFTGEKYEISLLGYIVKHGEVLEKLSICVSKDADAENGVNPEIYLRKARHLLRYQRASPRLNILIC